MKSWIILIVVAIATTVTVSVALPFLAGDSSAGFPTKSVAAPPADISATAPKVEVEEALNHEFGVMAQDCDGKFNWHFKNTGKGILELRNLGTDCSCTIAQIGKADAGDKKTMLPVEPGKSEAIELKWNTRRVDGGYRKSARIGTNDPRNPEVVLSVQGKVYPAVVVLPADSVVAFQTVSNDEEVIRKAIIYSKDRPDMKVTRVASSNESLIEATAEPTNAQDLAALKVDTAWTIKITLKPTANLGAVTEEVLLQTDHPEKPEVRLRVTGRVTGPITFSPERLFLHDANTVNGGSITSTVWVRGRTDTKVTVEKAPPGIEVGFAPLAQPAGVQGTKLRMTVSVAPGTPAGQINDEIVLRTDHPMASEIRIPIDVVIQGKH